ncbi:TPA: hypothetical protein NJ501_004384 [Vibrio parahaemolyticus]|nr:hypothetical protein [Vibrio parahaemolyticus]
MIKAQYFKRSGMRCSPLNAALYFSSNLEKVVLDSKVWQKLLVLESQDAVSRLYTKIHNRSLSTARVIAVNNAAKQAREYFRNSFASNYSVRPLLTFYGVASLSRALILLLKTRGGEETLTAGHGLTVEDWRSNFSGELHKGLEGLLDLKVHLCKGLFEDLMEGINNTSYLHVRSSQSDWSIGYDLPDHQLSLSFGDVLSRLPDLRHELETAEYQPMSFFTEQVLYSEEAGVTVTMPSVPPEFYRQRFIELGYEIVGHKTFKATTEVFSKSTAIFTHSHLNKQFGSIPRLAMSPPIGDKGTFSEISLLYISSYFMSMLVRYYPTYWVSLVQGGKGDVFWPSIYKAQQIVENTFPELVIELINQRAGSKI